MRTIVACAYVCAAIAGCAHPDNPSATLTITPSDPSGTVAVTGPTNFSAVIANDPQSDDTVTWTVSGGGTISTTTGLQTIFSPAAGSGATATLTAATAGGLTATVKVAFGNAVLTSGTIPTLTAPVTVLYDAQDIPHIKCAQAADCVAVQGYIHARDRFFMMDFLRHVGRSNLAELIGIDGLSQDTQIRALFKTRDGKRVEEELVANMNPTMLALITSYSAGVNAYLTDLKAHPANLPGEYKQLPFPIAPTDIADWTPADTMAVARLQQYQLSSTLDEELDFAAFAGVYGPGAPQQDLARFAAWVRSAAPKGEQAHTLSPTPHTGVLAKAAPKKQAKTPMLAPYLDSLRHYRNELAKLDERIRPYEATVGSNNWVISAAKSKTGKAMVANDPHLGLQYPPLFHLAAMTSSNADDHLDLTGGAFPGIPGALVGRGQHVGWGVTVVGYDVLDIYQESGTFNPVTSTFSVLYLGAPENCVVVPETFLVKTKNGLVNASTLGTLDLPKGGYDIAGVGTVPLATVIAPHHGPLVSILSNSIALSVRWTGQEGNTQDLSAFYGLDTATDVDSAMTALKNYATGAQNFVLADDQGHIAYDPHALVPKRPWANDSIANFHYPYLPVPGYNGQAEWGDGTHACAATGATPVDAGCWIADSDLPQGKDPDKGYFFTANADPTSDANGKGKTDDNDPLSSTQQPYMSFQWDDSTGFRATEIQTRIEAAIAAGGVSLDDMMSIQADHISRIGKQFDSYIANLPTTNDTADITAAKAILAKWDADGNDCPSGLTGSDPNNSGIDTTGTVVDDSAGCFLFHAFLRDVITNVFTDDLAPVLRSGSKIGVSQLQAIKSLLYMLHESDDTQAANKAFCGTAGATGTITTQGTCAAAVTKALGQAYAQIVGQYGGAPNQWKWGKVHTMQPVPLLALVTNGYEPGPYARPGGAFTVDVGTPSTSASGLSFPFGSSGNVRHISVMDSGTPIVKMQLPGPERDGPIGFGGPDLLGQWVLNKYFDFLFGNQIDSGSVSTQTFTAH
ncbi:MAG: penicillin acylase family protein [Kofleriaceae bacterium]